MSNRPRLSDTFTAADWKRLYEQSQEENQQLEARLEVAFNRARFLENALQLSKDKYSDLLCEYQDIQHELVKAGGDGTTMEALQQVIKSWRSTDKQMPTLEKAIANYYPAGKPRKGLRAFEDGWITAQNGDHEVTPPERYTEQWLAGYNAHILMWHEYDPNGHLS